MDLRGVLEEDRLDKTTPFPAGHLPKSPLHDTPASETHLFSA